MTKLTKRDHFEAIVKVLEEAGKPELVAVMNHELELLAKKNAYKSDKPTAKQVENEGVKASIVALLGNEPERLFTATEVQKALGIESNQRASALLRQLVEAGAVVKTVDKRKSYFKCA